MDERRYTATPRPPDTEAWTLVVSECRGIYTWQARATGTPSGCLEPRTILVALASTEADAWEGALRWLRQRGEVSDG